MNTAIEMMNNANMVSDSFEIIDCFKEKPEACKHGYD
jgi:hypothetical protein